MPGKKLSARKISIRKRRPIVPNWLDCGNRKNIFKTLFASMKAITDFNCRVKFSK